MSVDLGTARAKVLLDVSQLSAGVAAASGQFAKLEGSTKGVSSALSGVSTTMGLIGGAIGVGLGSALKTFGDFESQLNQLGVVSSATTDQMGQLSDLAKQIGTDTAFGATEAASGLVELSKAGVGVEDILAGAGKAAADLAQAGGQDLATAAKTMSNAMNVFKLSGDKAGHVADVLANAANKSSAEVSGLALALAQAGTVATLAGLSLEDTTAALAEFAQAGLQGSDAGTSFKTMLTAMIAPTSTAAAEMAKLGISFVDAQGNFVGLAKAADVLQAALKPLTQAQRDAALATIFGSDAIRAAGILADGGAASFNDYAAAVNVAGTAQAVAAANMQGLNGALEQMRGSIENAQIAFGSALAPAIEAAAGAVGHAADAFAALAPHTQRIVADATAGAGGFLLLAAAMGKTASFAVQSATAFATLATKVGESARAMAILGTAFSPVGLLVGAVAFAIGSLILIHHQAAEAARTQAAAVKQLADEFRSFQQAISDLKLQGLGEEAQALTSLLASVVAATSELGTTATELDAAEQSAKDFGATAGTGAEQAQQMRDAVAALNAELPEMQKALAHSGVDVVKLATFFEDLVRKLQAGQMSPVVFTKNIQDAIDHLDRYGVVAQKAGTETERLQVALNKAGEGFAKRLQARIDANMAASDAEKKALADAQEAARQGEIDQANRTRQAIADSKDRELARIDAVRQAQHDAAQAAADDAAAVARAYTEQIDGLSRATVQQIKGFEDASSALDGMQTGYRRAGESIADMLLRMDRLGKIKLTAPQEQALHLANALERVDAKMAGVDAAIANNEEDLALWQSRIKLVTDVLGGNTKELDRWLQMLAEGTVTKKEFDAAVMSGEAIGNFEKLDALLNAGVISQARYDKAKAAGLDLIKRSAGGIRDETNELVGNVIALDAFVREHDAADGAVKGLSAAQQGFLVGLQASNTQLFLNTLQLLLYLEAAGRIPEKKVTKFIADSAQADPVLFAVLQQLGLIDKGGHAVLTADDQASKDIDPVASKLSEVVKPKTVTLDFAMTGDGTDLVSGKKGTKLADFVVDVHAKLGEPDTSAVVDAKIPDKTVKTKLDPPDDTAVTGYEPPHVRIGTILGTPMTDLVDNFKPKTVHIPTVLDAPTGSPFGEGAGKVAGVTIPTILGSPDPILIETYQPPSVVIPTVLSAPGAASVADQGTVTIPTAYGLPDTALLAATTPPAATVPTTYGTPTWPPGTIVKAPDAITIDTKLATPDTKALDLFAKKTYTAKLNLNDTDFNNTYNAAGKSLDAFDLDSAEADLDLNKDPAQGVLDDVNGKLDTFDGRTATATLALTDNASTAIATAQTALDAIAKTYTATITVDTTAVAPAVQVVADHLPYSPAKKGPLSKEPSFDYVVDAFVAAMDQIAALGKQGALDLGPKVTASLRASDVGVIARAGTGGGGLAAAARHGPSTVVTNFVSLHSDDFARLVAGAEQGSGAFGWIIDRERAFATTGS